MRELFQYFLAEKEAAEIGFQIKCCSWSALYMLNFSFLDKARGFTHNLERFSHTGTRKKSSYSRISAFETHFKPELEHNGNYSGIIDSISRFNRLNRFLFMRFSPYIC